MIPKTITIQALSFLKPMHEVTKASKITSDTNCHKLDSFDKAEIYSTIFL